MSKATGNEQSISNKTLSNGDIGFSYKPKTISELKLSFMLALPFMILGMTLIVMSQFEGRWRAVFFLVPIVSFFFIYREINVVWENRRRERNATLQYFDVNKITAICKVAFGEDVDCLCRKYMIRHTDKFGVFERIVVAGLSNGSVVKFRVVQRTNEKGLWSLTIRTAPEIIDDEIIAFRVFPLQIWLKRYFNPENNVFVVFGIYFFSWIVFSLAVVVPIIWNPIITAAVMIGYSLLGHFLIWLIGVEKIPHWLRFVLSLPGKIVNLCINFTAPILVFLTGATVIVFVGMVIAALLYLISWLVTSGSIGWDNVNYAVFLLIASLSLSSVYANKLVFTIIEHLDVLWNMTDKSMESPMMGFIEYIYQKENINCLIYMVYLSFIGFSSAKYFLAPEHSYVVNEGVDLAVTKAFLVHIAFTNMMTRRKELKLKAHDAMDYVIRIMQMK